MYNFRTDMAVERNEIYKKQNSLAEEIDGIENANKIIKDIEISK